MAKVMAALCVTWLVAGAAIGVQGESELQLMQLAKITEACRDLLDRIGGATCSEWVSNKWCTSSGGYGTGWGQHMGSFDDWRTNGISADEACCGCGGGVYEVPTDSPTGSPTDSPTPAQTTATTQAKGGAGEPPVVAPQAEVGGTGDPHLRNMRGQRFDLAVPGVHVLLQIPRAVHPEQTLVRVEADAQELGSACADMYFQKLNVTGAWATTAAGNESGLQFSVSAPPKSPNTGWIAVGKVDLKVVWGSTSQGIHYLNVYVRHLTKAGHSVGGLLGEDDHMSVSTPPAQCKTSVALLASRDEQQLSGSIAEVM